MVVLGMSLGKRPEKEKRVLLAAKKKVSAGQKTVIS